MSQNLNSNLNLISNLNLNSNLALNPKTRIGNFIASKPAYPRYCYKCNKKKILDIFGVCCDCYHLQNSKF